MSHAFRPYLLPETNAVPTAAGVSVRPHAALALHDPAKQPNLGFIDIIAGVAGSLIGGFFGDKSESRQINAQKEMVASQNRAQVEIAKIQAGQQAAAIEAAKETAQIQAQNELAAINSAYAAQLSAMRVQKSVAGDQLSAQLVAGTQSGIFGLASSGLREAGSTMRSIPRSGTIAVVAIVGITMLAVSMTGKGRRRKKGNRRKADREEVSVSPSPEWPSPVTEGVGL